MSCESVDMQKHANLEELSLLPKARCFCCERRKLMRKTYPKKRMIRAFPELDTVLMFLNITK